MQETDQHRSASSLQPPVDTTAENKTCRICWEQGAIVGDENENQELVQGEDGNQMIEGCGCSGSQKYVHIACLRRWQKYVQPPSRAEICTVCTQRYRLQPLPRPFADLIVGLVYSPIVLAAISAAICAFGCTVVFFVFSSPRGPTSTEFVELLKFAFGFLIGIGGLFVLSGLRLVELMVLVLRVTIRATHYVLWLSDKLIALIRYLSLWYPIPIRNVLLSLVGALQEIMDVCRQVIFRIEAEQLEFVGQFEVHQD